jgi:fluoride exporter
MAVSPRLHILLHLICWSQAGTLMRVLLEGVFGGACERAAAAATAGAAIAGVGNANCSGVGTGITTPCLLSSTRALFLDLAPNVLGSFIMGLLSPSSVLRAGVRHRLTAPAPLAMLPRGWSLQGHAPLLVGARTGFCGSLTTFASWMLQVVSMFVAGSWVEAFAAIVLGVAVPMAALVVGQQVACALYARHNPAAFVAYDDDYDDDGGGGGRGAAGAAGAVAAAAGPAAAAAAAAAAVGGGGARGAGAVAATNTTTGTAAKRGGLARRSTEGLPGRPVVVEMPVVGGAGLGGAGAGGGGGKAAARGEGQHDGRNGALASSSPPPAPPPPPAAAVVVREVVEDARPTYTAAWLAADAVTAALGLALTALAGWQVALAAKRGAPDDLVAFVPTYGWLAVLLAPTGSFARYRLSRLNDGRGVRVPWRRRRGRRDGGGGDLRQRRQQHQQQRVLKWFPWGTWTANVLACALDFASKSAQLALASGGGGGGTWAHSILAGCVSGVGGTLSTVSTWVVELQRLMLGPPGRGWGYLLSSVGISAALGIAVVGGTVWGIG